MSASDFFHRFPTLHAFLLSQLTAATQQLESGSSGGRAAARMHPALYPVLALLARLRPSHHSMLAGSTAASSGVDAGSSPSAFAPLVQRCAAAAPAAVRRLAAEALPPLVPQGEHAAAAAALAAAVADASAALQRGEQRVLLNALQGCLLQLRELLAAAAGSSASHASELLSAVAAPLRSATWAADPSGYPCAAVSFEYLRAALVAAALPGALEHAEAAAWLGEVHRRCTAAVEHSTQASEPDSSNPMLSVAYKSAAELHLSLLLASGGSSSGEGNSLLAALRLALRSRRYEVRGAALKALVKHARRSQRQPGKSWLAGDVVEHLRALLVQALRSEVHHKAQRRLLALLALLPPAAVAAACASDGSGTQAATAGVFADMLRRAAAAADPRTRQHAVECLGPLLACVLASRQACDQGQASLAEARQLLEVVRESSLPHQLPELRLAAAQALCTSSLLCACVLPSAAGAQEVAVSAWAAVVVLLEDDDSSVREAAAVAVARAATPAGEAPQALSWEAAEALAFQLLPARLGPHLALVDQLCSWCWPAGGAAELQPTAGSGAAAAAGRIFDREQDNQHEEPLMVSQLAAASLARLLSRGGVPTDAAEHVRRWRWAALGSLEVLLPAAAVAAESGSISGAAVSAARFLALCQGWLAVWAAGYLPGDDAGHRAQVVVRLERLARAVAGAEGQLQLDRLAAAALAVWRQGSGSGEIESVTFLL